MRDQRDPAILGHLILSPTYQGSTSDPATRLGILAVADLMETIDVQAYQHDETSQSAAQRAYREKHARLAAQGVRASEDMLAYLDHPDRSQAHPGSLAADVDLRPHTTTRDPHAQAGIDANGDLLAREGE